MPDNQYPVFEGGQTLTAADLNQLRAFGHSRERLLGRLTGFGISGGLGGTVSGTTLTIAPGLGIDQAGEPLLLPAARTLNLPPAPSDGSFDFVAAGPGGFSIVLEATDTVEPAPACGETDCEGHAELHTRAVALRVAAGRITGPRFDFAGEPLLNTQPMRLSLTSAPQGSYVTLRDALVGRLANGGSPLIDPALITLLQGTSIAPADLPGVKGYKAGFLNQVLFATLDLLRCRALTAAGGEHTTRRPGLVLGWVRQVGAAWVWECAYRHTWEPPRGLSLAVTGGSCSSPCAVWAALLEGLISGYAPPDPPPVEDDDDGPIIVFPHCPNGMDWVGGHCVHVYYPPLEIPDDWYDNWHIDLLEPIWNPPDIYTHIDKTVETIYQADKWEYFGNGLLDGLPALGRDAGLAKASLETTVTGFGGTPNVLVLTAAQATGLAGYQPGGTFNIADTMVLTVGTNNKVTAMGRVPAAHTARELGTALPAATAKADDALAATEVQQAGLNAVKGQVGGLVKDVDGFKGFQATTVQWRKEVDLAFVSVDQTIQGVSRSIESEVKGRVNVELSGLGVDLMQRRLSTAEGQIDVIVKAGGVRGDKQFGVDLTRGVADFAGSVANGLAALVTADNESTLGRHVSTVRRATATLEEAATAGGTAAIGEATVELLGALRTAVKSAGVDPSLGRELDAQVRTIRGLVG